MNAWISRATMLALCATTVSLAGARVGFAQAPCASTKTLVDSARDEVTSVLTSGSTLVQEMRQEQSLPKTGMIGAITVVRDRFVCGRLATMFDHEIGQGVSFVVLRVGPLYYAREPDQHRGTGIITDSTYKVLLRLGVSISTPSTSVSPLRP